MTILSVEMAALGFKLSQSPTLLLPFSNPNRNGNPCFSLSLRNPKFRVNNSSSLTNESIINSSPKFTEDENRLIDALIGIQGRGRSASPQQLKEVERAVQVLEDVKGIPDPTNSSLIEGRWRLMFTTRPGTASLSYPCYLNSGFNLQSPYSADMHTNRTFVGVDLFSVFQEVYLRTDDPRVSNIVKFSDFVGELKVEAAASVKDGKRILFQFDRAAFSFKFLPFKVPYPVPFRLLGDEAKGWLDTTYLSGSGNIRISRGNKCRAPHLCFRRKLNQDKSCFQLFQLKME